MPTAAFAAAVGNQGWRGVDYEVAGAVWADIELASVAHETCAYGARRTPAFGLAASSRSPRSTVTVTSSQVFASAGMPVPEHFGTVWFGGVFKMVCALATGWHVDGSMQPIGTGDW